MLHLTFNNKKETKTRKGNVCFAYQLRESGKLLPFFTNLFFISVIFFVYFNIWQKTAACINEEHFDDNGAKESMNT